MNVTPASSSEQPAGLPRSPEMMRREDTALLVVDVQERFMVVEPDRERIVWNIGRLIDAAKVLGVRVDAAEQCPEKLGPTVAPLAERLTSSVASKSSFSCNECGEIFAEWREAGIQRVLVCGIETHVCVQQTVLDLLAAGYQTSVCVDAVGARFPIDHEVALRRMESSGALLTTTESAMFEWCVRAGTAEFKKISALALDLQPSAEGRV